MEKTVTPTATDLRHAQEALNALNVAYEYFTPAPWQAGLDAASKPEYQPFDQAA